MKAKHALIIWAVGKGLFLLGGLFKIQHWPLASVFIVFGSPLEAIGFVVLVFKALRYRGFKDFMES
jgi:predicted membrane protein